MTRDYGKILNSSQHFIKESIELSRLENDRSVSDVIFMACGMIEYEAII
jgi:hypothetical protein